MRPGNDAARCSSEVSRSSSDDASYDDASADACSADCSAVTSGPSHIAAVNAATPKKSIRLVMFM